MRIGSVAVTALLLVGVPASETGATECPPGGGTTVVVDFADLDGGVEVRCAPSASTGFEALAEAGFRVDRVQSSPGFLCRIDGRPGPEEEDCGDIPPDSAFWSYWTADMGGDWRFKVSGASASIDGDLEGWAFATDRAIPPRYQVPAPPTTTTTSTTTTTTTAPPETTTTTTTTTTAPPETTTASTSTTTTTPPETTTTTSSSTTTAPPTVPPTTTSVPSTNTTFPPTVTIGSPTTVVAAEETDGGGGFALATMGLAAVGAASWIVARRRFGRGSP